MAISLYDATVRAFLQSLHAVEGFLAASAKHFEAEGESLDALLDVRLIEDMLPLRFQLECVAHFSLDALEGVRSGAFGPPSPVPGRDWAGFVDLTASARASLAKVDPGEIDALAGNEVVFAFGGGKVPFTAEDFLLSFCVPNLHFHAATAYDILRLKGAPIGKRDFLGPVRFKAAA